MAPLSVYAEVSVGGSAAALACLFSNPLEVVKTRMQLQGELKAKGTYTLHYSNFFHAFWTIGKHEGAFALQKGLIPGIWYQLIMNGARLGSFQWISGFYQRFYKRPPSYLEHILLGASCGTLGGLISSPIYMVKTQLQASSAQSISVGYQRHRKGMIDALKKAIAEGGLWRGWQAQTCRVCVGSAAQLSTFAEMKQLLCSKDSPLPEHLRLDLGSWKAALAAAALSGLAVTAVMSPFDVISTRIYNQPVSQQGGKGQYYHGLVDCFARTVRSEGPLALYKGASAVFMRLVPHTVLSLVFWDQFRNFYLQFHK